MTARRIAALTALPGGAGTGDTTARASSLTELDDSRDDALGCALCAGVIEPGAPLTYDVDGREGFSFFHPDCALAPGPPPPPPPRGPHHDHRR